MFIPRLNKFQGKISNSYLKVLVVDIHINTAMHMYVCKCIFLKGQHPSLMLLLALEKRVTSSARDVAAVTEKRLFEDVNGLI
jgi:hypothetical protein